LPLVKAVDFVDEQYGALVVKLAAILGVSGDPADVGDSGGDGREGLKVAGLAIIIAKVLLPVPAGPYNIIEGSVSPSMALRSIEPGPSKCLWPTISSKSRGRIRVASGTPA